MTQNSKYKNDFELSHQEIDRTAESVSEILSDFHVERKTCLRARLLIEELLLGIMTSRDIPVTCRLWGNGSGNTEITVTESGDACRSAGNSMTSRPLWSTWGRAYVWPFCFNGDRFRSPVLYSYLGWN